MAVVVGLTGVAVCAANVLATPGSGFTAAQQRKGVFDLIDVKREGGPRWNREKSLGGAF